MVEIWDCPTRIAEKGKLMLKLKEGKNKQFI